MQAQQSPTSPQHHSPPNPSARANETRSDHPLPTQAPPLDQYDNDNNNQAYDEFNATQAEFAHPEEFGATQALVPSSEPDEEDSYMHDMKRPGACQGGEMGDRDERMDYPQDRGYQHYQEEQQYQDDRERYGNQTPISEHGEGAVALYGQPGPGRREELYVNRLAAQDQGRASMQSYPSVRMADHVEEPDSQMPDQHLYQTQMSTQYQGDSHSSPPPDLNARGATERAKGQFVPPQTRDSGAAQQPQKNGEHVGLENIGGRRVLTKQASAGRRSHVEDFDGEEDIGMREETKVEEFDPTAEIKKFDSKKVLVEDWDKIQGEIGPFLLQYAEGKLKNCFDEIFYVCSLFYTLNEDARKDLEEGVGKIVAEEEKQEDARKIIVDFSAQMEAVAARLSGFGGGSAQGASNGSA